MNNKEYFFYVHRDSEITTVDGFLNNSLSVVRGYDEVEFFQYSGDTDENNLQRIYAEYSEEDQIRFQAQLASGTLTQINRNTKLILPKDKAFIEAFAVYGQNQIVEDDEFSAFYSKQLETLQRNRLFEPIDEGNYRNGVETVKTQNPRISVWLWSKALGESNKELDGKLINVSPFVISCSTNVGAEGGTFEIELAPIMGTKDDQDRWTIDKRSLFRSNNDFVSQSHMSKSKKVGNEKRSVRSDFFFHHIINENDLLFIRFETLELEGEDRNLLKNELIIDPSNIPGRIGLIRNYDMIALVDNCVVSTTASTNDVILNVTGRDLMKLIVDDGCYFHPIEFAQGQIVDQNDNDNLLSRHITEKGFFLQSFGARKPIRYMVQFVLNFLSKIEVVPNELFLPYGNRVVKTYKLKEESLDKNTVDTELKPVQGIWQIVQVLIDKSIASRRLTDASVSQEDASIQNYFQKICQQPFVEFFGDTYADMYYFVIRKPPFTEKAIKSYLQNTVSTDSQDPDVHYEGGGGVISGNLTNGLTSDLIIVRNRDTENQRDLIISINNSDVINETLMFEHENYYNIFELESQEVLFGMGNEMSIAILPMVTLPEYVKRYGARRLKVVSNYLTHSDVAGSESNDSLGYIVSQTLNDLKYLIDINSYLPFTRKGSITINGDRRIKRGTFIRYRPTGEIFYVDSVSNSLSISGQVERTTTLTVSRGMVELFIDGVFIKELNKTVSYFNIVDSSVVTKVLGERFTGVDNKKDRVEVEKTFEVDKAVMNFFTQRRQFSRDYSVEQ
jgi:hypothetical protein